MNVVQSLGDYEGQFREIIEKALDKTVYASGTTPATPDTEFSIEHSLRYVPNGFIPIDTDKAAHIYKSSTPPTENTIYLKCNVASCVFRMMIF